jgi:hypothetical protein
MGPASLQTKGSNVEAVRSKGVYVLRVELSVAASGKLRES